MIYHNTYIKDLKERLLDFKDSCKLFIQPLTTSQLNWKHSNNEWSIAQILDHINIVNASYIKRSNAVIEKLNLNQFEKSEKFNSEYQGNMIINLISAENQIKTKTIPAFYPEVDIYDLNIKDEFCNSLIEFRNFILKLEHLNLNKGKVKFVDDNLIKFNLGDVLKIILVHMERHFFQIERLMSLYNFPRP